MPYNYMYYRHRVAPRVGAWIETVLNLVLRILD